MSKLNIIFTAVHSLLCSAGQLLYKLYNRLRWTNNIADTLRTDRFHLAEGLYWLLGMRLKRHFKD